MEAHMRDSQSSSPSQHPPKPHPELRVLSHWLAHGERKTTHVIVSSARGVAVESIETFGWLDGGYFLVSTYETAFGDEPLQTGDMYWGYDSKHQQVSQPLLQQQRSV
jgi:hypothetical protein